MFSDSSQNFEFVEKKLENQLGGKDFGSPPKTSKNEPRREKIRPTATNRKPGNVGAAKRNHRGTCPPIGNPKIAPRGWGNVRPSTPGGRQRSGSIAASK